MCAETWCKTEPAAKTHNKTKKKPSSWKHLRKPQHRVPSLCLWRMEPSGVVHPEGEKRLVEEAVSWLGA